MTLAAYKAGFSFIPGVFQYSGGVRADAGHTIERVTLSRIVPLIEGFGVIERFLAGQGLPPSALCACELRSPEPFTDEGFTAFNRVYAGKLTELGIFGADGVNPVARSNLCPVDSPPGEPGFHAFSYCRPMPGSSGSGFIVSGSGEVPEGQSNYRDHIIRRGDLSPGAMAEKAAFVCAEMARRLALLGAVFADVTAIQVYTAHAIDQGMLAILRSHGAMRRGFTWHLDRPPVVDIEFEMDCRRVTIEHWLEA
jgi:hypothetical protein